MLSTCSLAKLQLLVADLQCKNASIEKSRSMLCDFKELLKRSSSEINHLFEAISPSSKFLEDKKVNLLIVSNVMQANRQQTASNDHFANIVDNVWHELQPSIAIFKSAFFLITKMVVIEARLNYSVDAFDYATDHCAQLLVLIENHTKVGHFQAVQNNVQKCVDLWSKLSICRVTVPTMQTSMEEQLYHGPCSGIFWHVIDFYIDRMMAGNYYAEALCYLNTVTDFST